MHGVIFERMDGNGVRAGITGVYGIPGEKDNERRVVEFCAERGGGW